MFSREEWNPHFVVPVPLAETRQAERGFNQAELLARAFANLAELPVLGEALRRNRDTVSQVGLNPTERSENLRDAFSAKTNLVNKKDVLLLDDVLTTGATIDAAARALKQAGANKVYGLTLARAIW
ncbi:MAG: ComF family protein [Anaerolineales bacterium]